jgi:hypothetical protein
MHELEFVSQHDTALAASLAGLLGLKLNERYSNERQ